MTASQRTATTAAEALDILDGTARVHQQETPSMPTTAPAASPAQTNESEPTEGKCRR